MGCRASNNSSGLPAIGPAEIDQPLLQSRTVNKDVLTGTGLAGGDMLDELGGEGIPSGGDGSEVLNGGTGVDIAAYAGATAARSTR